MPGGAPDASSTRRWAAFLTVVVCALCASVVILLAHGKPVRAIVIAYTAASLGAVTYLYFRAAAGVNLAAFVKGERAPWLQPLFLPYRLVAWCVTLGGRLLRLRQPAISDVGHGLFVGVRLFVPEARRLDALGVRHILDLSAELPTNFVLARGPYERYQLPVLDRCPPDPVELADAADWVAARRAEGHPVFIHCAFGRGRSATMAAAALMRLGAASSPAEAVALLTKARDVIRVKGHQYAALEAYGRVLAEQSTR